MVSPPNTLHGWRFICGKMTQAGKAVIDQQEGAEVGAFGDDLGAPFSFAGPLRRAHLLTTRKLVVVWPAAIVRPPGAAPLGVPFPCRYIPADANSGLCIGRSRAGHRGLGGHRPPTSGTGYIPVHCLQLLPIPQKRVDQCSDWCYTLAT